MRRLLREHIGWKLLSILPEEELVRVSRPMIEKYMHPEDGDAGAERRPD